MRNKEEDANSAILNTLNEKNPREEAHCQRVSKLCKEIGIELGLTEPELKELELAGKLHDIGKIGIADQILDKRDKLTEREFEEIKRHSEIGYHLLSGINQYENLSEFVLLHHEKVDGSGYPKKIKGIDIPLQSRIIAIADSFDVMTAGRPYKKAMSKEEAIRELYRCAGYQFDPHIVDVFAKKILRERTDLN